MNRVLYKQQAVFSLDQQVFWLIAGSILGYIFGILPAGNCAEFFSVVPKLAYAPASFIWVLAVMFFPLLLSASAVLFNFSGLIPFIAFIKSACFTFCVSQIFRCMGDAGWLISSLLLFTSAWNMPILFFFWFRHVHGEKAGVYEDLLKCFIFEVLVAAIDSILVTPILSGIVF